MKHNKTHWFLIKQELEYLDDNHFVFTDINLLHQFNRVLKFKQGEEIVLFDGKGKLWQCEIKDLNKKKCLLKINDKKHVNHNKHKVVNLFFAVPKKNKFELIIEKGTEVGVSSFNPIKTDRTEKLNLKIDRAEKILVEAAEQSQNPIIPPLREVQPLQDVIQKLDSKNTFVFHTDGENIKVKDLPKINNINLLIGPEGGWSEKELKTFKDKKFNIYKIGDSVLKTETACIVIPFLFSVN